MPVLRAGGPPLHLRGAPLVAVVPLIRHVRPREGNSHLAPSAWAQRVALLLAVLLTMPGVAYAHARLISSAPADNSRLAESPRGVRLVFSEPIEEELGQIFLIGADGRLLELTAHRDSRDVHALVAPLEVLAEGAYRVLWRIVSADGHPVDGNFVFYVRSGGSADEALPSPPQLPTGGSASWLPAATGATLPLAPLLRGSALACLMGLAGFLLFLSREPRHRTGPAPRPPRIAMWLAVGAPVLLGAHLAAWLINISPDQRLDLEQVSSALGTTVGRMELLRIGLSLLALWAFALARRAGLAMFFGFAALIASGAVGHSVAIHPAWAVPAKALHLVAASVWLGGLLFLAVRERKDSARLAADARRVSSVALAAVSLVALSGLVQTFLFLPSPLDLVRSEYGALVVAKVAGLAALVAFGWYHRFRMIPRLTLRRLRDGSASTALRASVSREIAVMCAVVLLGGLLAYVPTPDVRVTATHSPSLQGSSR